jgi:transposase
MDVHKHSAQTERLEVVETGRRRRWSDDEKVRIVLESLETTRAISSTARRHGISRSLLMTWRRAFRPEPVGPDIQQSGFVRAVVTSGETVAAESSALTTGRMVIEIGKDRRVIVDAGVDAAALARVLAILERR